jgi:hypothetical protein
LLEFFYCKSPRLGGRGESFLKERNCNSTVKPLTSSTGVSAANFSYDETSVPVAASGTNISVYATKGRMSHWTTTNSGGTVLTEGIYSCYANGRTQDFWQCTPLDCSTVTNNTIPATYYTYDPAGDLTNYYAPTYFYHLSFTFNSAQQLTGVTQNTAGWIDTTARPAALVQGITYTPFGAVDTLPGANAPDNWGFGSQGCVGRPFRAQGSQPASKTQADGPPYLLADLWPGLCYCAPLGLKKLPGTAAKGQIAGRGIP